MAKCVRCGMSSLLLKVDSDGLCPGCSQQMRHELEAGLKERSTELDATKMENDALQRELANARAELEGKRVAIRNSNARLQEQEKEIARLKTPAMQDELLLEKQIKESELRLDGLAEQIRQKEAVIKEHDDHIHAQENQIIVNDELIELEEFSLYTPRFQFATSDEYKARLDIVRDDQKNMIKKDLAATGLTGWTVNGSPAKGKKMVGDMKKLCLRSFNNECDAAVASVRFNNYDRCVQRIEKSADQIAKLGEMMGVRISDRYKHLKIEELQLALECAEKKQEEKERLRELRAQQREEAKLQKEIEQQRKAAQKEQTHYNNAVAKLDAQIELCTNAAQREDLLQKKQELTEHLDQLEAHISDLDYREANQRAGYVYVISNIGSFGEGVYKIGMTRRLDPTERVYELSDASVPFNFDIHAMIFSDDAPALEAALHRAFDDRKVNAINHRREFFRVPLAEIKSVVKQNHDKTVEFVDYAPAEQYRETLKLIHDEIRD